MATTEPVHNVHSSGCIPAFAKVFDLEKMTLLITQQKHTRKCMIIKYYSLTLKCNMVQTPEVLGNANSSHSAFLTPKPPFTELSNQSISNEHALNNPLLNSRPLNKMRTGILNWVSWCSCTVAQPRYFWLLGTILTNLNTPFSANSIHKGSLTDILENGFYLKLLIWDDDRCK